MGLQIRAIQQEEAGTWDDYVNKHPQATLYHLYGWRNVIEKTYGHKTYYLAAINPRNSTDSSNPINPIVGLLPLVHLKHFIFGNSLISMPFFDLGGILANDEETEQALLLQAIKLGQTLKSSILELRHPHPLACLNLTNPTNSTNSINSSNSSNPINPTNSVTIVSRSHKSRMLLDLPESSETLMNSFKSKLRSQIKKPMKEGLVVKIGGNELLKDFYSVFSINMRELGSPVHSDKLMRNALNEFPDPARLVVVYGRNNPMACSLIIDFQGILENPWASALREYSRLSPNMLLYWSMLKYACDHGLKQFDFGRSTPGEGTYKFKGQWGAKPVPLHWDYISMKGHGIDIVPNEKTRFESLVKYWQRLPVPLTQRIGPMIRKHIGL